MECLAISNTDQSINTNWLTCEAFGDTERNQARIYLAKIAHFVAVLRVVLKFRFCPDMPECSDIFGIFELSNRFGGFHPFKLDGKIQNIFGDDLIELETMCGLLKYI